MTPAVPPPGVGVNDDETRTNIVGRLPTVTGCPRSCMRSMLLVTVAPAPSTKTTSALVSDGPRSRGTARRHAWSCRSRGGVASGMPASRVDTELPPMLWTIHPACTPAAAAPPSGSTEDTTSCRSIRRTSNPGSPLRLKWSSALSGVDGMTAKCERPSRPSMSASTARNSPGVFASTAFGRRSAPI